MSGLINGVLLYFVLKSNRKWVHHLDQEFSRLVLNVVILRALCVLHTNFEQFVSRLRSGGIEIILVNYHHSKKQASWSYFDIFVWIERNDSRRQTPIRHYSDQFTTKSFSVRCRTLQRYTRSDRLKLTNEKDKFIFTTSYLLWIVEIKRASRLWRTKLYKFSSAFHLESVESLEYRKVKCRVLINDRPNWCHKTVISKCVNDMYNVMYNDEIRIFPVNASAFIDQR